MQTKKAGMCVAMFRILQQDVYLGIGLCLYNHCPVVWLFLGREDTTG